jgi:hypothetical protein
MAETSRPGPERPASPAEPTPEPGRDRSRAPRESEHARSAAPTESFVAKIVTDPARVPAVWLLSGYLGDSSQTDRKRLYLTPDLSYWLEIPSDALLHTEPTAGPSNWLGTTVVWVRQDAQLVPGNRWSTMR